jgi:microcystin-dependent protein
MYAGATTAPDGWLLCQGQAVSRATFSVLFNLITTTYGVGDGSTTFNLPDMRGKVPLGEGTADPADVPDGTAHALADKEGAETHTLIIAELAIHDHEERIQNARVSDGAAGASQARLGGNVVENVGAERTESTGSGTAHNNLQPSLTLNFIIKY